MARILFVEDEQAVLKRLLKYFEREGFEVRGARTGADALEAAASFHPDVAVLDVMLHEGPGGMEAMDGYEICRGLRDAGFERPVIFLTARSGEQDKLLGFELGADDYVTKPFSLPELKARVEACLRRAGGARRLYSFGEVGVDLDQYTITRPDSIQRLSNRERDLLEFFLQNRGRILSRDELLKRVWGYKAGIATRTVDTHVLTVRKKLGDNAQDPQFIETLHGVGYQFIGQPDG
jgi:two-component system alkaline phosphatase synthesis response regulator PhoP